MPDIAIKVEQLSKSYFIGHKRQERYTALRDVLANKAKALGHRLLHPFKGTEGVMFTADTTEEFWALQDVSFTVKHGDRVGIIGRNGAGKSTLLKILSRITEPTKGRVELYGRVASLLEVGTVFHPELTGRENIYLNGAILGMSKGEIKRNFEAIVDFAEIEKFLDTPVKRYSSGMYVRLAFAVAAHLEPEILIVDEVLAVGDSQFQKKCLGKMEDVGKEGRTVLFVSHNMAAIQALCSRGIVLNNGSLINNGDIAESIFCYNQIGRQPKQQFINPNNLCITNITVTPVDIVIARSNAAVKIIINFYNPKLLPSCYLNMVIENSEGLVLIHLRTDSFDVYPSFTPGDHEIEIYIERISLRTGIYTAWFRLFCNAGDIYEIADSDTVMFEVMGNQVGGVIEVPYKWYLDGKILNCN